MTRKNAAAVALGRKGGKSTSDAKVDAARLNGAKGGRPRKLTDAEDVARAAKLMRRSDDIINAALLKTARKFRP